MSAARASARAVTSLDDGSAAGGSKGMGGIERDPAGEGAGHAADAPGGQPGPPADLLARVPESAQPEDGPVLRRAGGQERVPRRPGLRVLAGPRLGAGEQRGELAERLLAAGLGAG